jgi:hypothetical protein
MDDYEKYRRALLIQRAERECERFARLRQRFASIDERCPRCGNPIRFVLGTDDRNPMPCCWRCEIADMERENTREY